MKLTEIYHLIGCFENYLGARQNNDCWPGIIEANDWLFMYDLLDGRLRSERDYELLAYIPYTFVPWHKIFASIAPITLAFPKSDYEVGQISLPLISKILIPSS